MGSTMGSTTHAAIRRAKLLHALYFPVQRMLATAGTALMMPGRGFESRPCYDLEVRRVNDLADFFAVGLVGSGGAMGSSSNGAQL